MVWWVAWAFVVHTAPEVPLKATLTSSDRLGEFWVIPGWTCQNQKLIVSENLPHDLKTIKDNLLPFTIIGSNIYLSFWLFSQKEAIIVFVESKKGFWGDSSRQCFRDVAAILDFLNLRFHAYLLLW